MILTIIFLPLLSAIIALLTSRYLGRHGASWLTILALGFVCCEAWYLFLQKAPFESVIYISCYSWITTATTNIGFDLLIDNVTLTMFVVVATISFIVHWYSYDYMYNDPHLPRFMSYLSVFTFFMLLLVAAADFTILFIGWEGVGLLSYLLINFWYTRIQANKSALKAIFVNKIGDMAMLGAIATLYLLTGTTNICTITALAPYLTEITVNNTNVFSLALALFIIGAVGKSAQLFLHVWLPDAMEGPTPVSALLHAATMVTAGVFLLIRNSMLFEYSTTSLFSVLCIGTLTTFFAATTGAVQHDLKRIIAFSTCSQLGYMFAACGLSSYSTGLYHLFNHAFFKALLFLAAGSVIHALADEQDIRRMGALGIYLPLTFSFFIVASLSLMGIPFLSGFYSKDFIIELQGGSYISYSSFFFLLLNLSAILTAFYSARLIFYVFLNRPIFHRYHIPGSDANWWVQTPLLLLALLSIVSGFYFEEIFVGVGSTFFTHSIYTYPQHWHSFQIEYIPYLYGHLPLFGGLLGSWISFQTFASRYYYYYYYYFYYCRMMFFSVRWGFDYLYNTMLTFGFLSLLRHFYYFLDKGIIELWGPTGIYKTIDHLSRKSTRFQTGGLNHYVFFLSFCFFLLIIIFPILITIVG